MPLILTAGPLVEPVSLAEAKAHLRIETPYEDPLILSLILAARLYIERSLNIALITQGWSLVLDEWPACGMIEFLLYPVQSVTSVSIASASGVFNPVASQAYEADVKSVPARLAPRAGAALPKPGLRLNGIEIAFTAGYGSMPQAVPEPLRQAMLQLVAHWYEVREPVCLTQDRLEAPLAVSALLHPYRRARL
jgi:uncharacterized phiE125 gp8 family phage protein